MFIFSFKWGQSCQTFSVYFEYLNQMGAVCDNAPLSSYPQLEDVEAVRVTSYELCDWPQDTFFNNKIDHLKQKEGYEQFVASKTLKKHKEKDEYYIGDWDSNGAPKGQGILYRPGEIFYQGSFDQGPHGNGVLDDIKNQVVYDGEFNHGKIEGQGKFTHYHNHYVYEGTISNDSRPTTGKLVVNSPLDPSKSFTAHFNNYPAIKARVEYKDGREYQGYLNLKTFAPEGEGTSTYPNNSMYEGEWVNGQFHGKGKFTWPDGSEYFGDYHDGKKHGSGRFTYPSKKVYEGEWANGKQEGEGCLFDQAGDLIKKGIWSEGVFVHSK